MSDSSLKTVKMRMSRRDLEVVERLREWTKAENGATAISSALGVTHELARKVRRGDELLIRHNDGSIRHIELEGLRAVGE